MSRALGGFVGHIPTPSTAAAPGVWTLREASRYKRAGTWPVPGDLNFANVSLLLHMDGSNGSTTFTDSSGTPKTVTANGGAQISTAQSKFGGSSALFTSGDDYLTTATSQSFGFGTGDFTVEFWTWLNSQAPNNTFVSIGTFENGILFREAGGSGDALYILGQSHDWDPSRQWIGSGQWRHVALSRASGTIRVFVDGVQRYEAVANTNVGSSQSAMVGMAQHSAGSQFASSDRLDGYIDELRITKGVARYTSNFTPPTEPFQNS